MSATEQVKQGGEAKRPVVVIKKAQQPAPVQGQYQENKTGFWSQFEGQRLVFVMRGKQIIIGTFTKKSYGMVRLEDVTVKGMVYTAKVEWIEVDPTSINYFHPEGEVQRHFQGKKEKAPKGGGDE